VLFGERDATLLQPHLRDIGVVFQNYALFPHMSVEDNVAYPLRTRSVPAAQILRRVADALPVFVSARGWAGCTKVMVRSGNGGFADRDPGGSE
jgi:putative spermidine/putrescine transport system ATP-binding protein